MMRRAHYSTALAHAQGVFSECLTLFEVWEDGMSPADLFERVRRMNALNISSERRVRNVVLEGFTSRYLRKPHDEAAPALKTLFSQGKDIPFLEQINLIYLARQHGIVFDFIAEVYWPAVRAARKGIDTADVGRLIDRGLIEGRLKKRWSSSVRERVIGYVLGAAADLGLLGRSARGERPILRWRPFDKTLLYLAYDLHFLGFSDDEIVDSEHWSLVGLNRQDVTDCLRRLQIDDHLIVQDTGHLCRIQWKYPNRKNLIDVLAA